MDIDSLFSNMAKAPINGSGTYMQPGLYEVETKSFQVKESTNPLKPGNLFIAEFTILQSNNPNHAVGSTGSFVLYMTGPYFMGNINELIIAALGHENTRENQANEMIRATAAIVTRATLGSDSGKADLQALRGGLGDPSVGVIVGKRLRLECTPKATKPSAQKPGGGTYTVHKWSPAA